MEESPEIKTLKQMIGILEEMLFSIPMPIDVVKKYEFMRESATSKTGILLPPSKIWALQKVALERSQAEQKQESEVDQFLKKLDTSYDTIKRYQTSMEKQLHSIEQMASRLSSITGDNLYMTKSRASQPTSPEKAINFEDIHFLNHLTAQFDEREANIHLIIEQIHASLRQAQNSAQVAQNELENHKMRSQAEMNSVMASMEKIRSEFVSESVLEAERQVYETERLKLIKEKEYLDETVRNLQNQLYTKEQENQSKVASKKDKHQVELSDQAKKFKEEISQMKVAASQELEQMETKYKRKIQTFKETSTTLKESNKANKATHDEAHNKMTKAQDELKKQIENLENSKQDQVVQYETQFIQLGSDLERFKRALEIIHDRLVEAYTPHEELQNDWHKDIASRADYDNQGFEILDEVDFVCFLMDKLQSDNNWLVDRLSEFGEENEKLKTSHMTMPQMSPVKRGSPVKAQSNARMQVINEMKSTSQALKDFEAARSKLIENFENGPSMINPN